MNNRNHKWVPASQKCVKCQALFNDLFNKAMFLNNGYFNDGYFLLNKKQMRVILDEEFPCITDDEAKIKEIIE